LGRFQVVILNYKSGTGAKIRRWCKNSPAPAKDKIFLIFFHTLTPATSRRSEKIPLKYSQNLFGSTASRAQSGAVNVGIWRVFSGEFNKYRQVLS
jgi:hypothetical protein